MRRGGTSNPDRPWWGPREGVDPPNPLFTPYLFGLSSRHRDLWATALLVVAIAISRVLAFPASIWEQDEAYFGCAVLNFDVIAHHPHPPWFPLWIALGKLVHVVVGEPTLALQIVSLAASLWVVFPLVGLFAIWLRRDLAVAAAALYIFTPATLFLSSRAFSGPLATAFLVCACAFWFRADGGSRGAGVGSLLGGLCLLTRPHLFPPIAAVMGYRIFVSKSSMERSLVVTPLVMVVLMAFGAVAIDAGGAWPLWHALEEHAEYHFGELAGAELMFSDSGLARAFLRPEISLVWIGLVFLGLGGLHRYRRQFRGAVFVALLGLGPLVVTVYEFSYAGNVRYALPIIALGSGFAVLGMAFLLRKLAAPAVAVICVGVFVAAWPSLEEYRRIESPPVRAVASSLKEASQRGAVIVADGTLASFIDYERLRHGIPSTVLFAYQIGTETVPPPAWATVAVYDAGHGQYVERAEHFARFACRSWWLSRLSQGRFLDITVASGAGTRQISRPTNRGRENTYVGRHTPPPNTVLTQPSSASGEVAP